MIDNLALLITHALMMLTCWLVLKRPELDRDGPPAKPDWRRRG